MQNTMVRGGEWPAGKIKLGVREKNASFRPAAILFVGGIKLISKRGEGEMIKMHNIYP